MFSNNVCIDYNLKRNSAKAFRYRLCSFVPPSHYRYFPKFSDGQVWANSADQDQIVPDHGLHCLQFHLHLLDSLL